MCRCQRAQPAASETEEESTPEEQFHVKARIFYEGTDTPVNSARWELVDSAGLVACSGTTGEDGMVMEEVQQGGQYTLRVVEFPPPPSDSASGASA